MLACYLYATRCQCDTLIKKKILTHTSEHCGGSPLPLPLSFILLSPAHLSVRGPHRLVVRVIGGPRPQALIGVEIHGVDFLPANLLQRHSCLGDSETDDHEQRKHETEQEAKQCMRALCMSACLRNGTSFRVMLFNLCLVFTRTGCNQLQVKKQKQNYRAMRRHTRKDRCHNT